MPGKSLHEDFHGLTGIDLNRAGTPLLEIVSEPEMRFCERSSGLLKAMHTLVRYFRYLRWQHARRFFPLRCKRFCSSKR